MKAVIITYVVKRGCERAFEKALRRHWKTLKKEKLTTAQQPYLLKDPESPAVYKEIFEWKDRRAMQRASKLESVQRIWGELLELTEEGGIEPAHFVHL